MGGKEIMKKKNKPITDNKKKKIIELLKEKGNAAEVARLVKRGRSSVLRIANKNKIPLKKKTSKLSKEEEKKILSLLKANTSRNEIARIVKRSPETVRYIAKNHGIKFKFPTSKGKKLLKQVKTKKKQEPKRCGKINKGGHSMSKTDYITITGACEYSGVSKEEIYEAIDQGKVKSNKPSGSLSDKIRVCKKSFEENFAEAIEEKNCKKLGLVQAAKFLKVSRLEFYNLINDGVFKTTGEGFDSEIKVKDLEAYLSGVPFPKKKGKR